MLAPRDDSPFAPGRFRQGGALAPPPQATPTAAQQPAPTPPPPTSTPTSTSTPQDPYALFQSLTKNLAPTPDSLNSIASQLNAAGIQVVPPGKIRLPDGNVVDVLQAAHAGGGAWQWLTGDGSGGGGGSQLPPTIASAVQSIDPSIFTQPFNQTFTPPSPVDLGGPAGVPYVPPVPQFQFQAPTMEQAQSYPGYQFQLQQGLDALQNSAAAKGLLNSGGTLADLNNYAQSFAQQDYNNVYNQMFNLAQQQYSPLLTQWKQLADAGQSQTQQNFQNQLSAYQQAYDQYRNQANDVWSRLYQALTA